MPNGKEGGRGRDWEGRERGWWEEVMGWRKWGVCADVVGHCFKPIWNHLEPFGTVWNRLEPFGTASVGMAMAMVRRESVGKGVRRPRGEVRKRTGGVWAGGERRGEEK